MRSESNYGTRFASPKALDDQVRESGNFFVTSFPLQLKKLKLRKVVGLGAAAGFLTFGSQVVI